MRLVYPFHRNYRKEITKTPKVYFLDLGLRNYAVEGLRPLADRGDVGALFENFCFFQLLCADAHSERKINFWRTTNQTEIDFIVSEEGKRTAIETKWRKSGAEPRAFKSIRAHYPDTRTVLVSAEDFRSEGSAAASLTDLLS